MSLKARLKDQAQILELLKEISSKIDGVKVVVDGHTLPLSQVADYVRRQPECAAQVRAALEKMAKQLHATWFVTDGDIKRAKEVAQP